MTQAGQTDGFNATDHCRALTQHLSDDALDCVVLNDAQPTAAVMQRYRDEAADLVAVDPGVSKLGVRAVTANLIEDIPAPRVLWEKQDMLRHDPDKLADALCRLYGDMDLA